MTALQPDEITRIVEETARLTTDFYVFPDVGVETAAVLGDRLAAGRYAEVTDAEQLGALVTEDLQSVNGDRHLRLKFHPYEVPDVKDGALMTELTRKAETSLGGVPRVERLAGGVAVLKLAPILFPLSMTADTLTAGLNLVAGAEALVLDLRECVGGDPNTVAYICGYLFDEPTHLNTLYDRETETERDYWSPPHVPGPRFGGGKPLAVLTSRATFSAGEELTYDLKQLGRALVYGERTGGGANPRQGFTVHPHLEATIPVARAISPVDGTNWELTGIAPDVETEPAEALEAAHRALLAEIAASDSDSLSAAEAREILAGTAADLGTATDPV
ncbi:peptidase S41 [Kitasatospora sp. MMS16-BH015]|uniref:S41 family peptidase n=1 Tax=Kitasatospora sp. MMS16-BH015 TaxID=2018025 RepID=UPI000CA0FFFB|nr:S41 family peptidase [Kitasatospora sp. MMS16-BH015]AUG81179.1 peptidase S41 [Kitasatospora sp. MMS16-BH015]